MNDPKAGFSAFETKEEMNIAASEAIANYLDDDGCWCDGVEQITTGIIKHVATELEVKKRPEKIDEDGCDKDGKYWHESWDFSGKYKMMPIGK